jgi:hypothetical protein
MDTGVSIDELRALARAIALDGDLEVHVGADGSGWFIRPDTGVIHVDGGDLARSPPDDVRGLICHEAAHAAVTRYLHLVPRPVLQQTGIASLMNSLEDCRIEDWLAVRFPGTRPWIDLYNDRLFPVDGAGLEEQPWFSQFCLGAIHEWWHGELPRTVQPPARAALEATRAARERAIARQPPVDTEVDLDRAASYSRSRAAEVFRRQDVFAPPDAFERAVRLAAYETWRIVWTDVRPVYLDLIARDLEHAARMKAHEAEFLSRLGELRHPAPSGGVRHRWGLPGLAGVARDPGRPEPAGVGELPEELREAVRRVVDAPPGGIYEEARRGVSGLTDALFDELERVLRPRSYPRWVRGHPSGSRLDLRVAMAFEADPGAYLRIWERKTLPRKRDPCFCLLLDLSGSMSGDRIHHAFRGVVLMAEVLERLGVPFAVYGFQDALVPFKAFEEPLDAATRERLGGMPAEVQGGRSGGHNRPEHNWDGPVLERAADLLADRPAGTKVLLVVSDGEPSGPRDPEGALRQAVDRVLRTTDVLLVGVGLGPATDHVARFYPTHLASVPLDGFPAALGACVDGLLRA